MRIALAIALLAATAATAWPCPASTERCTKYDFMFQPIGNVYVRDARGETPRRRVNVLSHLAGSGWHIRAGEGQSQTLQLFDAANVPETYQPLGQLQILVSELVQVDHTWRVSLDGAWFEVMRCREGEQRRTCLVRVQ